MGASLLFTTPIDAPGRHHGKKVTPPWPPAGTPPEISKIIPGLRPGIPWTEVRPASTRGKKRAGLRPGPSGRERIFRKNDFCMGK